MTPPLLRLHLETIKEKEREGRRGDASYSTTDDIYLITTSSLIAGEIFSIPFSKNIVAFVFVAIRDAIYVCVSLSLSLSACVYFSLPLPPPLYSAMSSIAKPCLSNAKVAFK